ncbi:MAG: phage minor head protein [Phenylobacterium sp.]|uniref:phage minor head protein n=1 Tax=Phenylobacterium sp. TaxID=1871053 RepID=UPI0039196ABE
MPNLVFDQRAPAEAVDYLERKAVGGRFSFDWRDVWQEEHLNTFVVAKAMSADLLADMHAGLMAGLKEGWTKERYVEELRPTLQAKGWWGKKRQVDPKTGSERLVTLGTPRRLRVIYDTNMRMAHGAGRWERFMRSASTRPFLRYHHTPQEHPREHHEAWHGITLHIGHVFWKTHYTPNGWGCKCFITSHRTAEEVTSEEDLRARGGYDQQVWTNKRTGETALVPKGIDRGFGYNVGMARMEGLVPPAMPEAQRAVVVGGRQPARLPPLRAARPLPDDVRIRRDLPGDPQAVFEAFSKVLGRGEGEIFTDVAQVPLLVGRRMFERHDAAGASVAAKPGLASRAELAEIFAAVLRDPDEIWHSLQSRADGSSILVRNFVGAFDAGEIGRQLFVVTFHEGSARGVWMGTTAYGPGKRGEPRDQALRTSSGHRVGTLVYRRP